ncbi:sigma-70 family RNA polymerase sigma factor [Roseateles violae]|uniref:Sigma-70 family RNA polymerase sigma factor n=1 Tax=Roseateles violae TaxID=3058042 RepID=A0ABT8DSG8_9BURK|nr:sigma-70 family RNA polymerase sigma factor [Pelomonas sp. PFR6]MDN3920928.1 sigma-70 family RNA polymerase sigma factor [Pelomonas sp. PFR6]
MSSADPDAPLVELAQRGDMRAFEMLVIKYQRRIERLIARSVRDVDLVADISQESFLRAYRALPGFRGDSAFYTWLYRIAINTARKSMARLQRDPVRVESSLKQGDGEEEPLRAEQTLSDGATPEGLLSSKEVAAAVNAAVDQLPEDFRRALLLREVDGLAYEEIAVLMDCPVGTVRSRIFRAREAVAAKLRPLLDTRTGGRW